MELICRLELAKIGFYEACLSQHEHLANSGSPNFRRLEDMRRRRGASIKFSTREAISKLPRQLINSLTTVAHSKVSNFDKIGVSFPQVPVPDLYGNGESWE